MKVENFNVYPEVLKHRGTIPGEFSHTPSMKNMCGYVKTINNNSILFTTHINNIVTVSYQHFDSYTFINNADDLANLLLDLKNHTIYFSTGAIP